MRIARFIIVHSYQYYLPHFTVHFLPVPSVSAVLSAKAIAKVHFASKFHMPVDSRAVFLIPSGVMSRARGEALMSAARRCSISSQALGGMACMLLLF
jgi:hypothetical protein